MVFGSNVVWSFPLEKLENDEVAKAGDENNLLGFSPSFPFLIDLIKELNFLVKNARLRLLSSNSSNSSLTSDMES